MAYNAEMTCSFVLVAHTIQFFTKMEEKMHAKEDEMNKIQARKQVNETIHLFDKFIVGHRCVKEDNNVFQTSRMLYLMLGARIQMVNDEATQIFLIACFRNFA